MQEIAEEISYADVNKDNILAGIRGSVCAAHVNVSVVLIYRHITPYNNSTNII